MFRIGNIGIARERADVVNAFEHDQVPDAGLCQHIMVKSRQSVGSGAIVQQAISANTLVEHRNALLRPRTLETLRQHVGPAIVAVCGCAVAVGDRVAKRHDRRDAGNCVDVDSRNEIPVFDLF